SLSEFNPAYEYFYSHIENRLTELAGPDAAGEINLGRTRPEPLIRMALRPRILLLVDRLVAVIERLLDIAARESATVMPQWTHMQPAQPSTLGHYLLGVTDALLRDVRRLAAAYRTTNACTLGCGALAGTSYAVDRELVADLLGFDEVRENTIDCVASGDYGLETTAAVANLGITLSRLCEDLYLWHTDEFGLVEIGDAFAGSSSMMPQKKNAYPFEYVRARGARTVGEMVPPLFRTCDETATSLRLLEGTLGTLVVHRERCAARAASGFSTATELAAVLHRRTDLDYCSAHRVVGHLVLLATTAGRCPADVDAALVDQAAREVLGRDAGLSDEQVRDALDPARFVSAHQVAGGPAAEPVRQALAGAHSAVADWRDWLNTARSTMDDAACALAARVEEYVGGGAGD